jgi:protein-S-isoprenylcysteine O-methyltransferase Ste14
MTIFGILTLLLFIVWKVYWWVTEKQAEQEKPADKQINHKLERDVLGVGMIIVVLQLLGFELLPFDFPYVSLGGFVLVVIGIVISINARRVLGANWAHAADYQIKKDHTLITKGVYGFIRHPIYTGLLFASVGAELVVESYLFLFVLLFMVFWSYSRGKREEKILEAHFGKAYADYKKRTKMLIPFLF